MEHGLLLVHLEPGDGAVEAAWDSEISILFCLVLKWSGLGMGDGGLDVGNGLL